MGHEHDDDMELEVNEGLTGETEHYVVVEEDIDERDADAAEVDRAQEWRDYLHKAEDGTKD